MKKLTKATLTKAEILHVRRALKTFRDLIESYPELVTNKIEERLDIAMEIMYNENTHT